MNIDILLQNVQTLVTTPQDVAKLRQLILALAVQGKLVPQEAGDEPVEVLLGKMNISPLSITTTYPIELPKSWAWISPSQLGIISGGMTPSKAKMNYWVNGTINWYSSKDIKNDELYESELKISEVAYQETGLKLYPPGCLVFVTRSGILKHTFPVAINRTYATVNQDLKVLRPTISGVERYLQIMFKGLNNFIISDLVKTGMTVQSLMFDEFCVQPFPLPPLAEQRRIVARVDALMAHCDQLEAQLQERQRLRQQVIQAAVAQVQADPSPASIATLLDPRVAASPADLRQTILALAVQGKLVPQEAGEDVAQSIIQNNLNIKHIEVDEFHPRLPDFWAWVEIGQITELVNGRAFKPEDWGSVGLPIIRIQNLNNPEAEFNYYAGEYDDKHLVVQNDLLFSWSGTPGTSFGAFIWQKGKSILNQHIFRCVYNSEIYDVEFLRLAMNSKLDEMIGKAHGAVGLRHITKGKLQSILIPLPPLAEQRRIVARVDELMALVDRLEAQQTQASTLGAQVLDAVVGGG